MAWSEHIHIHIDTDDQKHIIKLLKEIKELLAESNDELLRQQIMTKLNKLIVDVKSTV